VRSDVIKKGLERAPHRSLLHALGCARQDFSRPFIGIVSSYSEIVPGHIHLDTVSNAVKEGVREAGGVPFVVNTIAICDGIAMGHAGMKFSLPSRELIADSVEVVVSAHAFDGLVFIPNCDKVIPGMLMAAARLNIPAIFVSGGPMLAGRLGDGSVVDLNSVFVAVGKVNKGEMDAAELGELEEVACPGCGSCSGMFTANTMNCLSEALGMALPGNGTIPATTSRRLKLAHDAGKRILDLVKGNIRPRDIITPEAIHNAFVVDMALGGSTNSVLHLIAIGNEAGFAFPLSEINKISAQTPYLSKIAPAGEYHVEDLDLAGGIPAVMAEVRDLLNTGVRAVTGTLADTIGDAKVRNRRVILPRSAPHSKTGGLAILFGNLAPEGAVVKAGAVDQRMLKHRGPARVFDSEEAATSAIMKGKIKPGDVVVIRYEGPRGGPGMREMLTPTSLLTGMGLDSTVALVTDGRFSGASKGAAIGHVSPEAAARGPIAALRDGDIVDIDIPERRLEVELTGPEIKKRLAAVPPFKPKVKVGYLKRYAEKVTSASTGAVFAK
jgi:dihydroxy-acid dehydratase